jgi:glutamate carboxypeptidase
VNTVAPYARGEIDLRYVEPADRDEIMGKIEAIVARSFVPGTRAKLTIKGEFLPLTQSAESRRVFTLYQQSARDSGIPAEPRFSGGCADSGFTAAMGAPTLCAVGPVGGKAHSPEEYLELDSFVPRAQALARAILRLETSGV